MHPPSAVPQSTCFLEWSLHAAGSLIFMSSVLVFSVATPGMPLNCLTLVVRGACIPVSHGTVAIRYLGSWQATTPRALRRQQAMAHPFGFPFVLELWLEGQVLGLSHI